MKTLSTEDIISILMKNLLFYGRETCEHLAKIVDTFDEEDFGDLINSIKEITKKDKEGY